MLLLVSLAFAVLPLAWIAWILVQGSVAAIFTIDGLFTTLILGTVSSIFSLNAFLLLLKKRSDTSPTKTVLAKVRDGNGFVHRGRVESVEFFEALVGQPNQSLVSFSNGASGGNLLVFEGDMRNALPIGQDLEITFRREAGHNVLLAVNRA